MEKNFLIPAGDKSLDLETFTKLIAEIASEKAISVYKAEKEKSERAVARKTDKTRQTKAMLSSYRHMKAAISEEVEFSDAEKADLRWKFIEDFMEAPEDTGVIETSARAHERRIQENMFAVQRIENAVSLYRDECIRSGNEEAMRRSREIDMMYMSDRQYTVQQIAEAEKISDKTVYKDLGIACKIIAVYLLGI